MLRTSLRSVRAVGSRPVAAARQFQPAIARSTGAVARRCFADEKKPSIGDVKPATGPISSDALKSSAPNTASSTTPNAKVSPPSPPAPAKKGFFRRLRNYVLTLAFLSALTFGGGVWYSRVNDSFHDFFTEYVPFGERAVLYFEELEFRRRYPGTLGNGVRSKDTGAQVKIAPLSGASWRVADSGEPKGRQSSAMSNVKAPVEKKTPVESTPATNSKTEQTPAPAAVKPAPAPPAAKKEEAKKSKPAFIVPEVDEPSRFPPPTPIDPLNVKNADEPVVQELVKMLNDIITVVNADNADQRFSSTIYKAKSKIDRVGSQIRDIKAKIEQDAAAAVQSRVKEFEMAANELVNRVEKIMERQEIQWRTEFAEEMNRIQTTYDTRFQAEVKQQARVNEEITKSLLLKQAIELKRQFLNDIQVQVETERNGRLGKLEQLSAAVKELEHLTTGWNDVVDANLRTQQLHVAVEAVRASLDDAEHPRPFVRELIALKEIATGDPVVNAAIASINPSAYQRGIATTSQLIDRFRRVASEVRKASLLPDDAGVASHASSWVLSKVMFEKQGLAAGDDVESILTRTRTYLEEGYLDDAAREMNGLQGWAKTLSRDWLGEVRKVLEVEQALDVIATQARLQSLQVE